MSFFSNPYYLVNNSPSPSVPLRHHHHHHPTFTTLNPKFASPYYDGDSDDEDEEYFGYQRNQHPLEARGRPYSIRELQELRQQEVERRQREYLEHQRLLEQQRIREMKLEQERIQQLKLQQQQHQKKQQELKKIQEMQLLERKKQQELKLAQQKEEQRRRRAILLRYTHAAKVIQRAFRNHLQQKMEIQHQSATLIQNVFRKYMATKKEKSAQILQRSIRRWLKRKEAQEIRMKLENLKKLGQELEELRKEHEEKVLMKPVFDQGNTTRSKLPNKDFLIYEDALLKS